MATLSLTIYASSIALAALPARPPVASHPSAPPPPHFQHLGYNPYAYPPLASPGLSPYGAQAWEGNSGAGAAMGLGAPPSMGEKGEKVKKGWLK